VGIISHFFIFVYMNIKDKKQEEFINQIVADFQGIHLISVRVGKCRIYLKSIQKHSENWIKNLKILILYPNVDVKTSWEKECDIINYHPDITYSTYLSIDKVMDNNWDYIICDEAHLCGEENQLPKLGELVRRHANTIIASGTYNNKTLEALIEHSGMNLTINYPTEKAIKDGIVSDFNVIIYQYNLNATDKVWFGKN
jgi:superfamily II DNA or RNA helicase